MKKTYLIAAILLVFILSLSASAGTSMPGGRLTGVNWFGFETSNYVVHGLWTRDYKSMLQQIKDLGFNCVRLPWSNAMIGQNPNGIQIGGTQIDGYTGQVGLNVDLEGLSSMEVLDRIIDEAGNLGLKIILDNHSRAADGYMSEELWYTDSCPESQWISDWQMMASRYSSDSHVVGFDLNNEPHGAATWGDGTSSTNWNEAAARCGQAILAIKPDALIIVEGVEKAAVIPDDDNYQPETLVYWYWWGGDLHGVRDYPITGIPAANLVYSPHEYGPGVHNANWFTDPRFPSQMPGVWDKFFWFIYTDNIAPVLIGEFGIHESEVTAGGTAYTWFTTFLNYVGHSASWTFWCMNPNSGDTGGILQGDWLTVEPAKYNILQNYLAGTPSTTTTTSATTSTTTTVATTSTTTTAATTSTTTTSGGSCDCGTCDWYGTDVPTCCESCSGWGWYDGGCRRSCVCPGSCPGGTTTTAATTSTTTTAATTSTTTTAATTSTTTTAATTSTTTTAATTSTTTTAATTSTTTTAATTTTTAAAGCTCDSGCDGTAISPNFSQNGSGQYCWQATSGTYINSWNLAKLEVNDTDYTNTFTFTSSFPAKIDGVWYIYYNSSVPWGHFELNN